MSGSGIRHIPEEQMLLSDRTRNGTSILPTNNGKLSEKQAFLGPEPVRLTPAWEETNLPNDELNFKGVTMEHHLEAHPPSDRYNIVYLIMFLHGMGTLLPWNMFINAKSYFVDYKLSYNYTGIETEYAANFLPYLGLAAQGPSFIFNWLNVFVRIGGKLSTRIVWSIVVEMLIFVVTAALAMIDSKDWPDIFYYVTMLSVVVLNMANGIYQNTIYGMAAKLPPKYTGAIILGSNVSGTFSSLISIGSLIIAPNAKTAAIYYFITALFVLSLCFDTYFALPLNRFYKYNELMHQKEIQKKTKETVSSPNEKTNIPHWKVLSKCYPQLFNIFFIFFVSLALFPSVQSDIKRSDENFFINDKFYVEIMCYLTFNVSAMLGSYIATFFQWPKPKYLWIPVILRGLIFVPLFMLCNYQPTNVDRALQVYITNDFVYLAIGILMAFTSGYFSSLAMMYNPGCVDSELSHVAGMYGAATLITGICCGLGASMAFPWLVRNIVLPF
ncbi:equilibrative nucleoside transporter 1 isoform X1 [Halyomorpha halys]|uniref:equilibrative nucleoside transporter 1 isoform X1 n=2 Tax=Halyomorpha halys TaxID=286706 RepID=UPI0006D50BBF|nr:equilibrative nucleoside transporter 1 isoform X1 [Halyomorpha halys]